MTTSTLPRPAAARPRTDIVGLEPTMATTGLALILSLALTLPASLLDDRQFGADPVWLKPIKFQIALILYTLTLAWFARWLPAGFLRRPWVRLWLGLAAGGVLVEMTWIAGAAMFATASHYNPDGLMARVYPLMGLVAVQLASVSLVFGLAMWRDPGPRLDPAVQLSMALGLILTFGLTVVAAGTLSTLPGHFVGTPLTGASVPVLGWSREVGDLRVAHFLATHALHALPLAGLAAAAVLPGGSARRAVWAAAALFAALTLAALAQALAGLPLLAQG